MKAIRSIENYPFAVALVCLTIPAVGNVVELWSNNPSWLILLTGVACWCVGLVLLMDTHQMR